MATAAISDPKFQPMSESSANLFVTATAAEMSPAPVPQDVTDAVEEHFLVQVLDRRIEAFKLPIKFTVPAKLAVLAYVDRPGGVVTLLIDCLNAYEGKTVDVGMLTDLYPEGFYDEKTLMRYVDDYLKPKKVKWAEIY